MSVSPVLVNRSKPAPEPMESMVIWPAKPSFLNCSAMTSERGKTVDEPAVMMVPVTAAGLTPGRILSLSSLTLSIQGYMPWAKTPTANRASATIAILFFIRFLPWEAVGPSGTRAYHTGAR